MAAITAGVAGAAGVASGIAANNAEAPGQMGSSTTQVKLPEWLDESSQGALDLAEDISSEKYDAEKAQQGFGATDIEKAGFLGAQGFRGSYEPSLSQVGGYLDAADQRMPEADLESYMNPYIESALDPAAENMTEQFARQRNQRNANAAARGAFGGLRNEIGNDLAEESYLSSIGDMYQRGMAGAYDRATQQWQQDRANEMNLANQYQGLAQLGAGLRSQELQAQMGAGATQRGINRDLYTEERDWDEEERLQPWLATLSSIPYGKTTSSTSTSTQTGGKSPLQTGIGTAMGIGGIAGQAGLFSGGG